MKTFEKFTNVFERVMYITIIIMICGIFSNLQAQNVPTDGRKVIKVDQQFEGEYDLEVFRSIVSNAEEVAATRIKKQLEKKYGFTNVVIDIVGSVQPEPNRKPDLSVALAQARVGANIETVIKTATQEIDMSKFQCNFTSDQGDFKLRLGMILNIRYIIKNAN